MRESRPAGRGAAAQWGLLLAASVVLVVVLEAVGLPAALLLGPMIAAIAFAVGSASIRVPRVAFLLAQGVVGALIARSITRSVFTEVWHNLPVFGASVLTVIVVSAILGTLLARLRVLPGTTAIWGSAPGAATAMVLMAERYGADVRLVAFMQYLRVVFVAFAASVVARVTVSARHVATTAAPAWLAPVDPLALIATLALVAAGSFGGTALRVPAGAMLATMVLAAALQDAGVLVVTLPPALLAASYALIGWTIGLTFTRAILTYALAALPRIAASILLLIAICGAFATLLARVTGIAPLTAYLATSPGGADSVAIIASSSSVDVPFVMAMQVARFLIVLIVGPPLARALVRIAGGGGADSPA